MYGEAHLDSQKCRSVMQLASRTWPRDSTASLYKK